jgi:hypothetical protein
MAFPVVVLYIVLSLMSPDALPTAIRDLHVNIILGLLAVAACLPGLGFSRISRLPDIYFLLSLLLASAIAIILTGWFGGVLHDFAILIPILITFPFVVIGCTSLTRLRVLAGFLVLTAVFVFSQDLIALLTQDYSSPYVLIQKIGETDDGTSYLMRYRGLGVLSDPNDLGQFFVTVLPLLWLRWKKGSTFQNILLTLLPASILLLGIFITHSRGALVGLLIVLWFAFKDKLGVTTSSVLAGLALAALLVLNMSGGRSLNDDDGGRVAAWSLGLEIFKAHPVFGVGMGNFNNYNDTGLTAHNSYVLCIAELGFFGYFAWMGMIVCSWSGLTRLVKLKSPAAQLPAPKPATYDRPQPVAFVNPFNPTPALALPYGALHLSPALTHNPGGFPAHIRPTDDQIAYAARILRISMVGMLATCFFLSRTYSMSLYVVLGMATSLRILEGRARNDFGNETKAIFKRVLQVVLASIVLLYLFVRLKGHG